MMTTLAKLPIFLQFHSKIIQTKQTSISSTKFSRVWIGSDWNIDMNTLQSYLIQHPFRFPAGKATTETEDWQGYPWGYGATSSRPTTRLLTCWTEPWHSQRPSAPASKGTCGNYTPQGHPTWFQITASRSGIWTRYVRQTWSNQKVCLHCLPMSLK